MIGILLYDEAQGRFIVEELIDHTVTQESRAVDLHCGTPMSICIKQNCWQDTRIEKDSEDDLFGWYFVGIGRAAPLVGHRVRIK